MSDGWRGFEISVILSTRDRAKGLDFTLRALAGMRHAPPWECLVVDNGSRDNTYATIDRWRDILPMRSFRVDNGGKSVALNAAIEAAQGEWLLFCDDDVTPVPDWLAAYADGARRWPQARVFGGRILPRFPEGAPAWARRRAFYSEFAFAWYEPGAEGPVRKLPFGPNFMVHRDALGEHRFDPALGPGTDGHGYGEETDLLKRLRADGHEPVYLPVACVQHRIRGEQMRLPWLDERAYRYGRMSEGSRGRPGPLRRLLRLAKLRLRGALCALVMHTPLLPSLLRIKARVKREKLRGQADALRL